MARQTSKDIPHKALVDGVIRFGDVVQAQVQRGVLVPRLFSQSSYYEHEAYRRALGSEATLFLRQNVLAFAVVTKATRDYFEEYFACVSQEGDATVVATLCPIFLLVPHPNRCTFPLLRYAISPPHSDVSSSPSLAKTLSSSPGRSSGPTAFRFPNARIASSTSYLDGTSSNWVVVTYFPTYSTDIHHTPH